MGWVSRCLPCPSCLHDHGLLPCDWCPCLTALILGVYPPDLGQDLGQPAPEPPPPVPNPVRWETASDLRKHHLSPLSPATQDTPRSDF